MDAPHLRIVPANVATCDELDAEFGTRGSGATCRCQRYRLAPRESFAQHPREVRAARQHDQAACGDATADSTSGLLAYAHDTPVGWCAVEPRPAYAGLLRVSRTPWDGRTEDRTDPEVWAVTCLFVRAGHRRRGISRALAVAAVDHARRHGARALEAYPMTPPAAAIAEELHVGTLATFTAAGFQEVHRPSKRRAVVRIEFEKGDRSRF